MSHPFLKIIPAPGNLAARLVMFLIFIAILAVVLGLLAILEITSLVPVDTEKTLVWVILVLACAILATTTLLWAFLEKAVLHPFEKITAVLEQEGYKELSSVAAKVLDLRETMHRTQVELDESYEALRAVQKLAMVGKLAAGVAHSVRNPLTAIKIRLFSLERTLNLTHQQREDFSVITEAMRHVDNVVSNFLEFSRRPQIQLQLISLSQITEATLRLFGNKLLAFPVSTTYKRLPDCPKIMADPEQLQEVILNILQNACEAMDYSGNLTITEQLYQHKDKEYYVSLHIQNSGPEISKEDEDSIFTPFFSTKEYGTGLGLPIAKGVMEEHGGDILMRSSPSTGTIFIILFPLP